MTISIDLKDGEKVLTAISSESSDNSYELIDQDMANPLLKVSYVEGVTEVIFKDKSIIETSDSLKAKLDELYLHILENNQSGTEDSENNIGSEEKPYDPDKIRVDTKSFSLRQIYDMIENQDLELTPNFQRYFVWDNTRQSRLIESILLRIPLPMFYFSQDEEGKITVVDGLQRLTTIKKFMDNELQLKNLEYLDSCENRYYQTKNPKKNIESKYFRWFNMTQIVVNIIDPSSPTEVKYDIFRRINTGGKPLNAQEIRNCLAKPHVRSLLNDMSSNENFQTTTLGSIKNTRMEAQEMALRFITFYDYYHKYLNKTDKEFLSSYSGNMATTLDLKVEELNKRDDTKLSNYYELYDLAMRNARYLFGDYAFRKCLLKHLEPDARKQLINKALFVSWSVLLADISNEELKSKYEEGSLAKPMAEKITNDSLLFNYITFGTNGRINIDKAFTAASELLK